MQHNNLLHTLYGIYAIEYLNNGTCWIMKSKNVSDFAFRYAFCFNENVYIFF